MRLTINGKVFSFEGSTNDLTFNGQTLFVNGLEVKGIPEREDRKLVIEGDVRSLHNSGSAVIRGRVNGSIENHGNLKCDTVDGDIHSSGCLTCLSVHGNMYT